MPFRPQTISNDDVQLARRRDVLTRVSRFLTISVGIMGMLVLSGWFFNIEFLKRPLPKLVAMNPLTAMCFILSSVSLFLLTHPASTKRRINAALGITYVVIAISMTKLLSLTLGLGIHIDEWLFHNKLEKDVVGNVSNRMAPNTAVAFLFTGAALLLLDKQTARGRVPSQYLALIVSMLGMLSVLGYLYRVQSFYGVLAYIPMAIHTAVCFLLIAIAILFAHPEKGLMAVFTGTEAGATNARIMIPAAIIIPQVLGFFRLYSSWAGLFSLEFGTALLILCTMVIFLTVVWLTIRELNRKEALKLAAQEQLRATNKELEAFSYSVSHDLRAPLRAIQGYTQMLNEDYGTLLDEEGKRIIGVVKNNTTQMGKLIDSLLAFSHLGRKEIQKTRIDMNGLINNVLVEIDRSVTHNAKIIINDLHGANGDYNLVHQVMFNLISNAIKYSSKKEQPVVKISSEKKGSEVTFSITDNGAGFDMQFANKLFGVFQRLHTENEFEGTGIGLAIIHRIIAKHGGQVWAEGKVDEGATFYFTLPEN